MKNTKNSYRHNATNRPPYTPGKKVFGEDAHTELIVLKRETAFEQILTVYEAVYNANSKIEFTIDSSCFVGDEEEFEKIIKQAQAVMALREYRLRNPISKRYAS